MDVPLSVLAQVAGAFVQLGIPYVLVGSFASSMHGMYRSTADIDILADIKADDVRPLFEVLQSAFYVDERAMRDAVAQRRSFNAIHFDSVFKVDIFIRKDDNFAQAQLDRRQLRKISPDREDAVFVATAEDTILAKLRWYQAGQEASSTQWRDVVGILGTSGENLDMQYLQDWAEKLGVTELLQKALHDVQEEPGV
jgi:hypothetical protein